MFAGFILLSCITTVSLLNLPLKDLSFDYNFSLCIRFQMTNLSLFVFLRNRFDRGWRKIEAFVGSKTVIQVYTCALLTCLVCNSYHLTKYA